MYRIDGRSTAFSLDRLDVAASCFSPEAASTTISKNSPSSPSKSQTKILFQPGHRVLYTSPGPNQPKE